MMSILNEYFLIIFLSCCLLCCAITTEKSPLKCFMIGLLYLPLIWLPKLYIYIYLPEPMFLVFLNLEVLQNMHVSDRKKGTDLQEIQIGAIC